MIITIKDNIPDDTALMLVLSVVNSGKVSHDTKGNDYYCWATTMRHGGELYDVWTRKNPNQPSFIVCKHKGKL